MGKVNNNNFWVLSKLLMTKTYFNEYYKLPIKKRYSDNNLIGQLHP